MERGERVCGDVVLLDFWCGFAEIFILFCGIAVLQDQAVCCIWEFWGNFSAVLFCAVFIPNSVGFAVFIPPFRSPLYGSR